MLRSERPCAPRQPWVRSATRCAMSGASMGSRPASDPPCSDEMSVTLFLCVGAAHTTPGCGLSEDDGLG